MDLCWQSKLLSCDWSNIDIVSPDSTVAWAVISTKFEVVSVILLQPINLGEYLSLAGIILWKINKLMSSITFQVSTCWYINKVKDFDGDNKFHFTMEYQILCCSQYILSLKPTNPGVKKIHVFKRRLQCTNLIFMKFIPDEY